MRVRQYDRLASGIFSVFLMSLCSSVGIADGGAIRLSKQKDNYQIVVFTAPTPLRAGPADISVLINNSQTQALVPEAKVTIKVTPKDHQGRSTSHLATTDAATNKLFRAATFELPEPGWWEVEVFIDGPLGKTTARFEVEAAPPLPKYVTMWPWIAWPIVPILVFAIHQSLQRNPGKWSVSRAKNHGV